MKNRVMKWSAAMLGLALLLGLVGMSAGAAIAQGAPPNPPARYAGTVTVDGTAAAAGASVQAWVGGAVCATTAVNAAGTYVVDVSASCGGAGTTVSFSVDGALATETAAWSNSALNVTNLKPIIGFILNSSRAFFTVLAVSITAIAPEVLSFPPGVSNTVS